LANVDVNVTQRLYRFTSTFFTVQAPADIAPREVLAAAPATGGGFTAGALWQEILANATPLAPEGNAIVQNVEDLQAMTHVKVVRARKAVELTLHLVGQDFLVGTYWMDLRKIQDPSRQFGPAPTAALAAWRRITPWQADPQTRPEEPLGHVAYRFIKSNPVRIFYTGAIVVPAGSEPQTPWLRR
jgi:histidine ammonia-lyase